MSYQTQTVNDLVQAKVVWWNERPLYVRCPSCGKIHRHGFSGKYTIAPQRHFSLYRPPHDCEYELIFPFNEVASDVVYEINKERPLFVAGGENPTDYFLEKESDDRLPDLIQAMKNRLYSGKRRQARGDFEHVRQYLDSSTEPEIFLHGVEAYSSIIWSDDGDDYGEEVEVLTGKTTLHEAACEKYPQIVELLLQKGADPNAADISGRVPLADAALWGRLDNVKLLLEYGAEKQPE